MQMIERSRDHLKAAGEGYFEHLRFAGTVGLMTIGAGLACLIHALVPALCERTCSRTVALLQELFADRDRLPAVTQRASGAMTFTGLLGLALLSALAPMTAGASVGFSLALFVVALAIPAAFLLSNSELEPV